MTKQQLHSEQIGDYNRKGRSKPIPKGYKFNQNKPDDFKLSLGWTGIKNYFKQCEVTEKRNKHVQNETT